MEYPNNPCNQESLITISFANADFSEVFAAIATDVPNNGIDFDSEVVEVSVVGKFDTATLCFLTKSGETKDNCLAYFESKNEKWICQDKCLEKNSNNQICGKTDHFTSFAILLGGGLGECGDDYPYVTGSFQGDLILVGSVAAFCVMVGVFVILLSYTPLGQQVILGQEGSRIIHLRSYRIRLLRR